MRKRKYYVGVVGNDGKISLVTNRNNTTHFCMWNTGKTPLEMSLSVANDTAEALNMNLIPAVVVQSFFKVDAPANVGDVAK